MFHSGHLFHLPKLSGQSYRGQKTLITVNIFSAIFSNTDHIIRSAKRISATFLKAPEPKTDPRASHALLFSGSLNPTRRRVAHFLVSSFYQQARPAPSCTSKPPSVLSKPCFSIFLAFQPPRVFFQPPTAAPFLGRDLCVPWEGLFFISSHFSPLFGSRHTRFFFHSYDPTSL